MALSTAEPALPYGVAERWREADSEQGKLEKEMMIEGHRERQALKGFQASLREDRVMPSASLRVRAPSSTRRRLFATFEDR